MMIQRYFYSYSLVLLLFVFSQSAVAAQQANTIPQGYEQLTKVEGELYDVAVFPADPKTIVVVDSAWRVMNRKEQRKAAKDRHLATFFMDSRSMVTVQMMKPPAVVMPSKIKRFKINRKTIIGTQAPRFEFLTLKGKTFRQQDLLGQPVVLNFWFIKCPPCRKEIPDLNELVEKYASEGVVFIAIALDSPELLQEFLSSTPLLYHIVPKGRKYAKLFEVQSYPTNLVIDRTGKITFYTNGLGPRSVARLGRAIRKVLK